MSEIASRVKAIIVDKLGVEESDVYKRQQMICLKNVVIVKKLPCIGKPERTERIWYRTCLLYTSSSSVKSSKSVSSVVSQCVCRLVTSVS